MIGNNTQFLSTPNPDRFEEENFLLFETMNGEGELVSARQLRILVKEALPDLDVVFVAACRSEFVGEIFLRCGARHVICVKKDRSVLDAAAIAFTKYFY